MAKRIRENKKGEASGWYQAGNLAATGLRGGAGLWLATHYNLPLTGIVLCIASLLFAMVMLLIKDIPHLKEKTMVQEIKVMGKDILSMIKLPVALFVMILIIMPIGTHLWALYRIDVQSFHRHYFFCNW
ncbi:hypothetical protein OQX61_13715 [Pedobacter sp. PLR]|uniref:hypothetical protein n=1 Tax=Pedobacter sp. PLR TaxID=2994465 RepID=UPI002246C983|nr:hypothetical protein [Pedobacter sp. PLR]MCX2452326.1 hypothetical protein [Pedobacter sp. PLR]